jgi:hypothetical protein
METALVFIGIMTVCHAALRLGLIGCVLVLNWRENSL